MLRREEPQSWKIILFDNAKFCHVHRGTSVYIMANQMRAINQNEGKRMVKRQYTTRDIKWHQVASSGIRWNQLESSGIKWHQVASGGNKWHQVASNSTKCHRGESSCIKWNQVASCCIEWHQVTSSGIKWYQVASGKLQVACTWFNLMPLATCYLLLVSRLLQLAF